MKILLLGSTGATGKLVLQKLLSSDIAITAIVRESAKLATLKSPHLTVIQGTILELPARELEQILTDCDVIISCLGHNLTFKGIFGKPRMLVTDSIKRVCAAANKDKKYKLILMSTTANQNRELKEKYSTADKAVLGLLELILPPHTDNIRAAGFLAGTIGKNSNIEWVAVRPDGLINEETVSRYSVHSEIQRNPIFNAGKVSRINVSDFMVRLATDDLLWKEWKYQMPALYSES